MRIGLPAVVFSEHLDIEDEWDAARENLGAGTAENYLSLVGQVQVPSLDVVGYTNAINLGRRDFRHLRIFTGVEFGESHRWKRAVVVCCRAV